MATYYAQKKNIRGGRKLRTEKTVRPSETEQIIRGRRAEEESQGVGEGRLWPC